MRDRIDYYPDTTTITRRVLVATNVSGSGFLADAIGFHVHIYNPEAAYPVWAGGTTAAVIGGTVAWHYLRKLSGFNGPTDDDPERQDVEHEPLDPGDAQVIDFPQSTQNNAGHQAA